MAKEVLCRNAGFDCDGVVTADTEKETPQKLAAHATSAHGLTEVTPRWWRR